MVLMEHIKWAQTSESTLKVWIQKFTENKQTFSYFETNKTNKQRDTNSW